MSDDKSINVLAMAIVCMLCLLLFAIFLPFAFPPIEGAFDIYYSDSLNGGEEPEEEYYDWFCTNGFPPGWDISTTGTYYTSVLGDYDHSANEDDMQLQANQEYTWKKIYINVLGNTRDGATTITSRINGGDGNQVITVSANTTGIHRDLVNTDSISEGDLLSYKIVTTGTTGTITYSFIESVLNGETPLTAAFNGTGVYHGASYDETTYFQTFGYFREQSTQNETRVQYTVRTDTTFSNMRIFVDSNTLDGISTYKLRKNGADGNMSISIGAGQVGEFEDTSNSDTFAAGDELSFENAGSGSSGDMKMSMMQIDSSSNDFQILGLANPGSSAAYSAGGVYYASLGGNIAGEATIESTTQQDLQGSYTTRNLFVNCTVNSTDGETTVRVRKDGANTDMIVTIPANTAGWFEDTSNTASFVDGDLVNFRIDAGSGVGTIYISTIAMELAPE